MQERYASKEDSWTRWKAEAGEDPRVETGFHCLVGPLLAWGLFHASDVAKPQFGHVHSEVLGCRSNHQYKRKITAAFQGRNGKETRSIDLPGNPRVSQTARWVILWLCGGAMARGCKLAGSDGYWVILKDTQKPLGDNFSNEVSGKGLCQALRAKSWLSVGRLVKDGD